MRTKNLFRTMIAATLVVVSTSAFAQKTTTGFPTVDEDALNNGTDYVTVGATMPYDVEPYDFGSMAGDFNPSYFEWNVTGGVEATNWNLRNPATNATFLSGATTVQYDSVNVQWILAGAYVIDVTETSNPISGAGCTGNTENFNVSVINRPLVGWNAGTNQVTGACDPTGGAAQVFPINVDVSGTDRFQITLSLVYTDQAGTPTTVENNTVISPAFGDVFAGSVYETLTNQNIYTLTVPDGDFGRYVFTFNNISDRISRKSGVTAIAADYNTTGTYTVVVYPTPTTQKIKHVSNTLLW